MPHQAGQNSRSRSNSDDALRHGSTGATAMRVRRARPIGIVIVSKYGRPIVSRLLFTASTTRGKTVPSSTMKANNVNNKLFNMNAPSRETGASMEPGDRSLSPRHVISASVTAMISPKNESSHGPMAESLKA
jgi:hypothetical protein